MEIVHEYPLNIEFEGDLRLITKNSKMFDILQYGFGHPDVNDSTVYYFSVKIEFSITDNKNEIFSSTTKKSFAIKIPVSEVPSEQFVFDLLQSSINQFYQVLREKCHSQHPGKSLSFIAHQSDIQECIRSWNSSLRKAQLN